MTATKANKKGRSTALSPSQGRTAEVDELASETIGLSIRLPKPMHDSLRKIVFEEGNRGNRISIHSLVLEGIAKVITEKR
jgi:hypothetical protein